MCELICVVTACIIYMLCLLFCTESFKYISVWIFDNLVAQNAIILVLSYINYTQNISNHNKNNLIKTFLKIYKIKNYTSLYVIQSALKTFTEFINEVIYWSLFHIFFCVVQKLMIFYAYFWYRKYSKERRKVVSNIS